jgi:hypothetical protein
MIRELGREIESKPLPQGELFPARRGWRPRQKLADRSST